MSVKDLTTWSLVAEKREKNVESYYTVLVAAERSQNTVGNATRKIVKREQVKKCSSTQQRLCMPYSILSRNPARFDLVH